MARILPLPGTRARKPRVIRITELALPLDYPPDALRKAVSKRLQVRDEDLLEVQLFKRSYDARKKNAIKFVCIVDVSVRDEAAVLKRFAPLITHSLPSRRAVVSR